MGIVSYLEKGRRFFGERNDIDINKRPIKGSRLVADTEQYRMYEYSYGASRVIAAFGEMAVTQNYRNKNKIILYPYIQCKFIRYNICLNDQQFPGLLPDSNILSCQLIPYLREVDVHRYQKTIRLILITDKAQIYHNYPARRPDVEGFSQPGDIARFEESVIWDLPNRKHPSKTRDSEEYEKYFPGLPDVCYEYHPILNTDNRFTDTYGNGGFPKYTEVDFEGKKTKVSRFYIFSRNVLANPFHFIGTGERNYKMSLIATYRGNVYCGVRTCIFASSDGGRTWYCKYEFADAGCYDFSQGDTENWGRNFGNPIKNVDIKIDWCHVKVMRRTLCFPRENEKEPKRMFQWMFVGYVKKSKASDRLILELDDTHELQTGNIIALCADDGQTDSWIINNEITAESSGNQSLFKIEVCSNHEIALYELVSNVENNIPCRHIHHVNRIKDGWIIGTGEIYPNGWLLYLQVKEADTFAIKKACEEFSIVRLNSTEKSVQRTMGAILLDNSNGTFIYASDHDTLERNNSFDILGRKISLSRNSTGIFKGLIKDVDDRNQFEAIYEASEPCFYFQKLGSMFVFCGQQGELAISFDEGATWKQERLSGPIIKYYGNCRQIYYFDTVIIIRK